MNLSRKILLAALLASVAACAPKPPPPPPPPPPAPPPVVVIPPRPMPPGSAALTQILPARGIDGRFLTANSNIMGDRAFWQMKIALNVAAIGCRGNEEATLVSAYNSIIKTHARTIKSTETSVIKDLAKANKTNGIKERDRLSTSLFNYFAQPPAQREFCARANEVAQLVATTPSAQVIDLADENLAVLDKPFIDFYEAYAQYQRDVVDWDAKYAPPPLIMDAPATPADTAPIASGAPSATPGG